jgi:hypothetical protein
LLLLLPSAPHFPSLNFAKLRESVSMRPPHFNTAGSVKPFTAFTNLHQIPRNPAKLQKLYECCQFAAEMLP